jgi:uncharacterized SAM-binding protein YcdF (DUF218 family)
VSRPAFSPPIARAVEPPHLDAATIARIGCTVFRPSVTVAADVLLVFGTIDARWDALARACRSGLYGRIVLAGGRGPGWEFYGTEIAHGMHAALAALGVPAARMRMQDRSHNTLEDVAFSLDLLAGGAREPRRIAFASKAPHSGRCWLTLRRFFPRVELCAHHLPPTVGAPPLDAVTWWDDADGRASVYAEFLRIVEYSARGDIAAPVGG